MINKPEKITDDRDAKTGRFLEGNSGGGRPKGSRNKFTKVKEEIVQLWEDADLKGKLKSRLKSSEGDHALVQKFVKEIIVPVLPKEPLINNTTNVVKVDYGWSDKSSKDQIPASRVSDTES